MIFDKILKSVVIALLMTSVSLSQSVKESFEYDQGTFDGYGEAVDGWGGPWTMFAGTTEVMNIIEGSLEFPGIPSSGNSFMGITTASDGDERAYRELETVWPDDGGSYWISYLMEVINPTANDQSWQGVSLYLNDGTELVLFGKVWGLPNLGVMAHTLGSATTTGALTWEEGLVWTVIRIDMSGDDQNERCFMWFNPDPASEPDTSVADVKADLQLNNGFERVVVHFGHYLELEVYIDELRLGTSFNDVSSPYTSVSQFENHFPNKFELSNNYPNPFNPSTQISYTIPGSGMVKISVYNLLGSQIAVLVNEMQNAGTHTVSFDASNLASGMYVYKLECAGTMMAKKMLVLK
jgi:hypothetical protein